MQITCIKETCLYVEDLARTREFYEGQMGFKVIGQAEGRHIFFRAGTSVLLCFIAEATKQDPSLPPHYGSGKLHLAFECRRKEYLKWKEKIISLGIPIEKEQEWGKDKKSFYLRDPDGHLLEIVGEGVWD